MRFAWPSKRASNRAVFRSMRRLPVDALQAPVEVPIAIFQPAPQCSHVARLMRVSRPPSRSSPTSNPHSNRCQPVPNCPRLRALALFRRRPPERVVRSSLPASKNLHKSGPQTMSASRPLSPQRRRESRHSGTSHSCQRTKPLAR
jgi:hypothetical protein